MQKHDYRKKVSELIPEPEDNNEEIVRSIRKFLQESNFDDVGFKYRYHQKLAEELALHPSEPDYDEVDLQQEVVINDYGFSVDSFHSQMGDVDDGRFY